MYYVYVIECATPNHYYIGLTQHFADRIKGHMRGKGPRFTSVHGFKSVIYQETWKFEYEAKARERELTKEYKWKYGDDNVAGAGWSQVQKKRIKGARFE